VSVALAAGHIWFAAPITPLCRMKIRCAVPIDSEIMGFSSEDEVGLAAGLAGLSRLVAGSGTLEQLLIEVANFAVGAVPGANGAGVTMLESGQADTIVASATFVRDVDSIQYRLGEGPCISAAATARTTGSAALGEDEAWPTFGPQAAQLGIHSALSLPLILNGEVIGALNVYAHTRDAFDESSRRIGELFAGPAAVAIHNARVLGQAQRTAAQLESAMVTRSTIDHAVGIVMSRSGISADEAFVRLRIMSQHEHIKLAAIAKRLVEDAVRRTRARRAQLDS
jgi:transcriptional regulator with GAF, ATPase, and Fis domain